jgi:hypothetical protein
MNIQDHISESLEIILKFFDADADPDLGFKNLFDPGSGIRDKHLGSATLADFLAPYTWILHIN